MNAAKFPLYIIRHTLFFLQSNAAQSVVRVYVPAESALLYVMSNVHFSTKGTT